MENLYLERGFDQIEYQILGLISMIWSINGGKKPVYQRPFEQTTGLSLNLVPRLSRFLPFSEAVSEFIRNPQDLNSFSVSSSLLCLQRLSYRLGFSY